MESSADHGLASIEVERIAYAAIGRHLRVMCFLCLLLLVLGFLIGHHVANLHSRTLAQSLEGREEALRTEITKLTSDVAAMRLTELEGTQRVSDLQGQVTRQESALTEARQQIESAHALRQSQVVDAIEQMDADRRALLRELKPYEDQDRPLPPQIVSGALSRVIEAQRERLNRLIEAPVTASRPQCPVDAAASVALVPVSESGPSPTIAPGTAPATTTESKPAAASEEIDLFTPPARVEASAPVTAPPPPPETPVFAKPAPFTPAPVPAPAPPPAPVASDLVVTPAPAPSAAPAVIAPAPLASAPAPAVIPATGIIDSVPLQELHGHEAAPLTPEARRGRTTLFFTPTRKNPANSVPAIPIAAPAPTQTTSAPPAKLR